MENNETKQWRGAPFGRLNPKPGSRFMKVIPASEYRPAKKAMSRRDLHRLCVKTARQTGYQGA